MDVKILSWNIWLGQYLPEIKEFLAQEAPDVILLQEACSRPEYVLAEEIAAAREYNWVYFPSVTDAEGISKGNAVLSRYPIVSATCFVLSPAIEPDGTPTAETRTAVRAQLSVEGSPLTVLSTHLGYAPGFAPNDPQATQVGALLELVRGKQRLVLMGDLNALPDSETISRLSSVLTPADSDLSDPTWTMYPHEYKDHKETRLKDRIDYMFTSPDMTVKHFEIGISKGSNHLPIWGVVEV